MASNDALINAARQTFNLNLEWIDWGVEDGVVWCTARGKAGVNGYAMIPAEGHPWSKMWPNGEDQPQARDRTSKMLKMMMPYQSADFEQFNAAIKELYKDPEYADACGANLDSSLDLDNLVHVHGGVSWFHHPWIGFDTIHAWDVWPPEWDPDNFCKFQRESLHQERNIHWTPQMVADQARDLARQIAAIGHAAQQDRNTNIEQALGQLEERNNSGSTGL